MIQRRLSIAIKAVLTSLGCLQCRQLITILGLSILLISQESLADSSCPTRDLRSSAILNLPRNQKSLGWCYAYSLADLIGYRVGKKVSPIDLALGLYRANKEYGIDSIGQVTRLSGGLMYPTFDAAKSRGLCWENKVSASGDLSVEMLYRTENVAIEAKHIDPRAADHGMQVQRLVYRNSFALQKVFPTSTMGELVSAFANLNAGEKPLISVVNNICGERTPMPAIRLRGGVATDSASLINILKWRLSEGTPLSIGYSGNTLRDVKFSGPVTHASTVVGMRQNRQGECEFLVRNSWGTVVSAPYDATLRPKYFQGNIWITETLMKHMAKEVYFIDSDK